MSGGRWDAEDSSTETVEGQKSAFRLQGTRKNSTRELPRCKTARQERRRVEENLVVGAVDEDTGLAAVLVFITWTVALSITAFSAEPELLIIGRIVASGVAAVVNES